MTLIRSYEAADRAPVVALWTTAFGYDTPRNEPGRVIDTKLAVDDGLFFVALDGDTLVGTVMGGYDGHRGWIYSLAVDADRRRQGLGAKLVEHVLDALRQRGCLKVNLQVRSDNSQVVDFYHRLGFETEPRVSMGLVL